MRGTRRAGVVIGLISLAFFAFPSFVSAAESLPLPPAGYTTVYDFPINVWGGLNGAFQGGSGAYPSNIGPDGVADPITRDFDHWYSTGQSFTFSRLDTFLSAIVEGGNTSVHPIVAGSFTVQVYEATVAGDTWVKSTLVGTSNPTPAAALVEFSGTSSCHGIGTEGDPFTPECISSFDFPGSLTLAAGTHYVFEITGTRLVSSLFTDATHTGAPAFLMLGASLFQPPYGNDGIQLSPNLGRTGSVYIRLLSGGTSGCTQDCYSSVLFLPGLKGSVLKSGSDTLWPADAFGSDIPKLALNEDGTSLNPVIVDGILPNFKITIPQVGTFGPEIYSGFITLMNGLVAQTTIQEWKAEAYDWRYSADYIVSHDIQTAAGPENMVATVEGLASRSKSGKVTIIAHSMGGLVGKALIKKLEAEGKAGLIDSFIMVGTPELGTPQAVGSLLHGDKEGIPGNSIIPNVVTTNAQVRTNGRNFPGAYSLLPSSQYFATVADPILTFDTVFFTQTWRTQWGTSIAAYQPFYEFLTGTGVMRTRPASSQISFPEVLRPELVDQSKNMHAALDSYSIPSSIRVVEIAGWGKETTKAYNYTTSHLLPSYESIPTIEGDGVVVYPSATAIHSEDYFINLSLLNKNEPEDVDHGTLLNSEPIKELIEKLLKKSNTENISYVSSTKPVLSPTEDRFRISTYSPVILGAYDSHGNFTGIYPDQDLTAPYLYVRQDIPGSSFDASGDTQSIYLPKEGTYSFVYKGTGTGPTTVKIDTFSNDSLNPISNYADIPTTPNTSASFTLDATAPETIAIQVDQNGDGQADTYIAPDGGALSLDNLLTNLKTTVQSLNVPVKSKTQLLNKIANIETKIAKQKTKQSNVLAKLKAQIQKKASKGKIDTATANSLSTLLDDLIGQSSLLPIDTTLIQQLKDQMNAANITVVLKNSLLVKVARIESLAGVNRSLDSMTKAVQKKGSKGVLTDVETQNLLNLLDQIQAAI